MDEQLIGYLLDALGPEERDRVESNLARDAAARERLTTLRRQLAPLELDREEFEPPAALAARTLARVAAAAPPALPEAPVPCSRVGPPERGRWHRADVLVAASLLLLAVGLGLPALLRLRGSHELLACQNNLRGFYAALKPFSEQHQDRFPDVAAAAPPPRNIAGLVMPILASTGQLPPDASVRCPGAGDPLPPALTLDEVLRMKEDDFQRQAFLLAYSYAYSLGYRDAAGGYCGPRFDPQLPTAQVPLMSDCPPVELALGNSRNHGARGQNVLFIDGHVQFCTTRAVGPQGDDIFLNRANEVGAGLDALDAVLGRSTARP